MKLKQLCIGLGLAALVLVPGLAAAAAGSVGPPVRVTPTGGHGYEPAVYTDHYGDIFATAHKENWQLARAPAAHAPTFTRSMSWACAPSDGGHPVAGLRRIMLLPTATSTRSAPTTRESSTRTSHPTTARPSSATTWAPTPRPTVRSRGRPARSHPTARCGSSMSTAPLTPPAPPSRT